MERYRSYSSFLKERFGKKVYKICIDGGFTCPNRDVTISFSGCTFCSEGGSGDFCESASLSIKDQILLGQRQTREKYRGNSYIAYFQAFTNTYASLSRLRELYGQAMEPDEIVGLAIGTRPDCLPDEVLDLLAEYNRRKPVFLELGLQTCHDETAARINRGYESRVFEDAVIRCEKYGLRVCAHIILGLPGEDDSMIGETISFLNGLPVQGVKLSMLHILKNTPLATQYDEHPFHVYTMEEYTDLVVHCIERLRPDIVIERLTGDGPKDLLIAPLWSRDKKRVLNLIHHKLKSYDSWQGKKYKGEKHGT